MDMAIFEGRRKIRILEEIYKNELLNITALARKTNMCHNELVQNLQELAETGLIKEYYKDGNHLIEPLKRSVSITFEKKTGMEIKVTNI